MSSMSEATKAAAFQFPDGLEVSQSGRYARDALCGYSSLKFSEAEPSFDACPKGSRVPRIARVSGEAVSKHYLRRDRIVWRGSDLIRSVTPPSGRLVQRGARESIPPQAPQTRAGARPRQKWQGRSASLRTKTSRAHA